MADIRYRCPYCGEKLCVNEAAAGMGVLCPQCRCNGVVPHRGPLGHLLSVDVRFRCPSCEKKMVVDIRHANEVTACPGCGETLTIPGPPGEPEASSQTPASVLSKDEVKFLMAP